MPIDDRLLMAMNHFERALGRLNEVLALPENDVVRVTGAALLSGLLTTLQERAGE